MLLGGTGCQQCGCVPCVPCDAVCSETAVGFEVVYSGNTTDGYLTWSGTANPVNAVPPVTGPYNAQVTGNFYLPGDDFPCYARLRVWRNIFTMNPGATETPTSESVVVTCATGKIRVGIFELRAGESVKFGGAAPTSGDAITYWTPATNVMTVLGVEDDQSGGVTTGWNYAIESLCSPSSGSITARVEWTDDDIYHAIYAEWLECGDEGPAGPCTVTCAGVAVDEPATLYMTISNQTTTISGAVPNLEGTYALGKNFNFEVPLWCKMHYYFDDLGDGKRLTISSDGDFGWVGFGIYIDDGSGGEVDAFDYEALVCGTDATGSATCTIYGPFPSFTVRGSISFDWSLST